MEQPVRQEAGLAARKVIAIAREVRDRPVTPPGLPEQGPAPGQVLELQAPGRDRAAILLNK